jgi:hypothetical protein
MTVLEVGSVALAAPRLGRPNPLSPLRLLGELHGDVDTAGLDAELARNLRYGTVPSVLPYLLEDDYSCELVPQRLCVDLRELRLVGKFDYFQIPPSQRLWICEHRPPSSPPRSRPPDVVAGGCFIVQAASAARWRAMLTR